MTVSHIARRPRCCGSHDTKALNDVRIYTVNGLLKMEVSVRMDECDSLAHVEEIADQSGQRHVVGFVLTVQSQPPGVRSLDVRLREERLAILGCAQVVQRNKVGVA